MLDGHGWVSVAELIFYIPALVAGIFVCLRHGFNRSSGWLYTIILCVARITGAICRLVSYKNPSTGLFEAIVIIDSLGLGPLLLATLGLLSRFIDFVIAHSKSMFGVKHFRVIQLVILVGLILSINGGTHATISASGNLQVPTTSKVGIALYCVAFLAIVLISVLSIPQISSIPAKERRVPFAVMLVVPFIFVRLLYSVLSVALHSHIFSIVRGNLAVWVVMSVVEEMIVVAICILAGFAVDKLHESQKGAILNRGAKKDKKNKKGRTESHAQRFDHRRGESEGVSDVEYGIERPAKAHGQGQEMV